MRVKSSPWSSFDGRFFIHVGLKKQVPSADVPDSFQRILGVFQVIKHTIEKNHVERPETLRLQIINIHQIRRCVRLARSLGDAETPYGVRKGIDTDNFARAAFFRFKREKSLGASDIEDALSF